MKLKPNSLPEYYLLTSRSFSNRLRLCHSLVRYIARQLQLPFQSASIIGNSSPKRSFAFALISMLMLLPAINFAQTQPPYYDEIQNFKHLDSLQPPPQHAVLFIGSSSFRKWTDVQDYFPNHTIINRGFGGSALPDLIRYEKDIVPSYHAKQIVIYCGDNDLAASDTVTPTTVLTRFQTLFKIIRFQNKNVPIVYVSIKPSPSRQKLMTKMQETNKLIKDFLSHQKQTTFVDVFHPMLTAEGLPNPSLFLEDNLHMKPEGYKIWQRLLEPVLL